MKSSFPTRKPTAKLGELGVSIVSRIFSDAFGWLFKRNHQEHDFGIDGQVEIVADDGAVTGQVFSVQIKCGDSFLKEKNQWGYVYRGEAKHFNYLANYPVPVLLCICDPNNHECYWVVFEPQAAQPTESEWKFTVPFENRLRLSKEALLSMFPPLWDAASDLKDYWEFNNMLVESGVIQYVLDEHDVANKELALPRAFFDRLRSTRELAHACQGKVEITFSGYDDDPRELFEIEEVRLYVAMLDHVLPELFFFLRTEQPTYCLKIFALCLTTVEWPDGKSTAIVTKQITIDMEPLGNFLERHWLALNELTEWLNMPLEENKRISMAVVQCLGLGVPDVD